MDKVANLRNYSILLLAAGVGRRLGKIGKIHPKCMLSISNKTLLEIIINELKKRKVKKVTIIIGYKANLLQNFIKKKIKNIKVNFIKINNFKENGHSVSWYAYRKFWFKEKKPMLLLHTDIFFDPVYIDHIVKNKKTDIIGVKSAKGHFFKSKSFAVKVNKKNKIEKIDYINKIKYPSGEIIGINKISAKTNIKIFNFMDNFFDKKGKKFSWEEVLNKFIKNKKNSLFTISNQNFYWININDESDYLKIKNIQLL